MTPREAILSKINSQIAGGKTDTERRANVANRLSKAPLGIIPERGNIGHSEKVELFCSKAIAVQSTVSRLASADLIPGEIATYLRQKNLPQALRMGSDERLAMLDWSTAPGLTCETGPTDGSDEVGLSHANSAIAETGTLVLISGADNPTTLNFLPENHIIVVRSADIEGDYESALGRIRQAFGKGRMPRTVNMVTGPSRSGDIEQKILLGAHGPRSLHIIVVDD
ncbi:MAG: LutC/YkgG family protein [Rhizobiaceae bacterium]